MLCWFICVIDQTLPAAAYSASCVFHHSRTLGITHRVHVTAASFLPCFRTNCTDCYFPGQNTLVPFSSEMKTRDFLDCMRIRCTADVIFLFFITMNVPSNNIIYKAIDKICPLWVSCLQTRMLTYSKICHKPFLNAMQYVENQMKLIAPK